MAVLSTRRASDLAHSALPDAPIVITAERDASRTRTALATRLRRLADFVAPPPPTVCAD
jgi:hypothetical protein